MPLLDNPVQSSVPVLGNMASEFGVMGEHSMRDPDWVRKRRPYLDDRGRACVSIRDLKGRITRNDSRGGEPKPLIQNYLVNDLRNRGLQLPMVCNAATLTKQQWQEQDTKIYRAFRQRLRAVADLESAGLIYGGFNAMGRSTLEYTAVSDPGQAYVDMYAETDGTTDTPLNIIRSLPLPITHSDFGFYDRELEISRSGPMTLPLDTFMGEVAGRRIAESVEDHLIGNQTGITYGTVTTGPGTHTGTSTVYGYRNFPQRLTKTNFTAPTAGGWVPNTLYNEVLAALDQLYAQMHYGPYVIYHSTDWTQYMNQVFSVSGGNHPGETTRSMLLKIENISDVRRLDRLTSTFTLILVGMEATVVEMVNGMEVTTVQWQEKGGLVLRYKVMCIKVPRLRSDFASRTGILHGTTV